MSTERDATPAADPNATACDMLGQAQHRDPGAPEETVAATGEFLPDAQPDGPAETLAGATGEFHLDEPTPKPSAPPRSAAAREQIGQAPTEVIEPTGMFEPSANQSAGVHGPEATIDMGSGLGLTLDLAATGAFDPACTDPASPSAVARTALPVTDIMATGDYGGPTQRTGVRPRPLDPASRCGRYVLKQFHAKGGMGEIWLAEDPDIGRPVALKRMLTEQPDQVNRFRVEAQVTGQLEHPGVVPVHELGVNSQGQTYYAMKFVAGQTLKKFVEGHHKQKAAGQASEVEDTRLLQIFLQLCQTVAYAHSRGVLHRDLKPENVMLGEFGETILLDWGIAKVFGQPDDLAAGGSATLVQLEKTGEGTETHAGAIMGTPAYMAPEVAYGRNQEVDFQSDVYLLGATLYEMLTGRQPRSGKTALEMIKKARKEPPARIRTIDPSIPKALDAICFKAMAQEKRDRYESALALADDVQRFLAGEPVTAYREDFWERAWRWAKRHRAALRHCAAVLFVLSLGAFGYTEYRQVQRERAHFAQQAAIANAKVAAQTDLKAFLRLADEASFYAATSDQTGENAPYSDPQKGAKTAQAALAIATKWGPGLEKFPLDDERPLATRELEQLNRLTAHLAEIEESSSTTKTNTASAADPPRLAPVRFRDRGVPTRLASSSKPVPPNAGSGAVPASAPAGPPKTAIDHFFAGETYRARAARHRERVEPAKDAWKPDQELMEKAIGEYRKALTIDPTHYWSQFQLGRCNLTLERFNEAIEALGGCIAMKPDSPWAYSVRGFALLQNKQYDDAEHDLNRAVALNPELRAQRLNRGVLHWRLKHYEQALADFAAVLAPPADLQLVEAAFYRGMVYADLGKKKQAIDEFTWLVERNPRYGPAYYYRAALHFGNGDEEFGIEDLDRYIANGRETDRDAWRLHGIRGHLLRYMHAEKPLDQRRGKSASALVALAIGELMQALALGGQAYEIFDDIGAMLEHSGRANDAIAAYSKGIEVAPDNVKLRNKRGWALEGGGRHDLALADFIAAAKAEPTNGEAHAGAGYVLAVLKQVSQAQREADLAMAHGADDYLVLHNVACIYATLADGLGRAGPAYQDVAIALLQRAIAQWKAATDTRLDEIELIKGESAFKSLRSRPDFQKLIAAEPATKAG